MFNTYQRIKQYTNSENILRNSRNSRNLNALMFTYHLWRTCAFEFINSVRIGILKKVEDKNTAHGN